METNITIDEELYRAASLKASREGVAISDVVEKALREFLGKPEPPPKSEPYKLQWRTMRGELMPGVNIDDRKSLYDIMDGLDTGT